MDPVANVQDQRRAAAKLLEAAQNEATQVLTWKEWAWGFVDALDTLAQRVLDLHGFLQGQRQGQGEDGKAAREVGYLIDKEGLVGEDGEVSFDLFQKRRQEIFFWAGALTVNAGARRFFEPAEVQTGV
jgi:hypothetical protein